jgi:hypothetical protein
MDHASLVAGRVFGRPSINVWVLNSYQTGGATSNRVAVKLGLLPGVSLPRGHRRGPTLLPEGLRRRVPSKSWIQSVSWHLLAWSPSRAALTRHNSWPGRHAISALARSAHIYILIINWSATYSALHRCCTSHGLSWLLSHWSQLWSLSFGASSKCLG